MLGDGYQPEMQEIHERNAARLETIVGDHGWPGKSLVGEDGAEAAWLILQHAISRPDLMRAYLPLLEKAANDGEIPRANVAYLTDRICFFEGRLQMYGTHYDLDDEGRRTAYALEDASLVNERRAAVGLPLLQAEVRAPSSSAALPEVVKQERMERDEWARSVGWRD